MMNVSLVPRELVPAYWDKVESHLAKAVEYTHGRYEIEDIFDALMDYDYNLWIAFDDEGVKGAVVTKFNVYPRRKYLDMVFTGEEHLADSTGRPGWAKICANDGHRVVWHTYELPAGQAGLGAQNG